MHADYRCRHAGACCTAGWDIPVEGQSVAVLRGRVPEASAAWLETDAPPPGSVGVLRHRADGSCVAFDRAAGSLCAIQRACGHQALPVACQQFPRVALIDDRGVHVTLSHFCPTAASLLFREHPEPLTIVECGAGELQRDRYEGFDATRTVPPFLKPGVTTGPAVAEMWKRFAVGQLSSPGFAAEDALARVARAADTLRAWTPDSGTLESRASAVLQSPLSADRALAMAPDAAARLFSLVTSTVPPGMGRPELPGDVGEVDARFVRPVWPQHSRVVGRYLAARSFGAWCAYQGDGLRTQVAVVAAALAVLRIECIRQAAHQRSPLDDRMLLEAIRQADLLVVHQSSGEDLVRKLGGVERMSASDYLDALGLSVCPSRGPG